LLTFTDNKLRQIIFYFRHFIRKAEYGSSLSFYKIFQKASKSSSARIEKSSCMETSVQACMSGGFAGFGSFKACVNAKTKGCDKSTDEGSKKSEYSKENLVVISKGSRPVSMDDWANGEDFVPVPLKVVIEPMENLLTEENFKPDSDDIPKEDCYGIPQGIDVKALKKLFRKQNE